jgi:PAS domain S-box-containing protein
LFEKPLPDDADFIGNSRRKSCDKSDYRRISPLAHVPVLTLVQPLYANLAFECLTGYPATEILGRNCRFLQGEDRARAGAQKIRRTILHGQYVTVTLRNYRKDGTLFYNEVTLSPLHDQSGQVAHFVGYQTDVTAREEAALQDAQMHQQLQAGEEQHRLAAELQLTLDTQPTEVVLDKEVNGPLCKHHAQRVCRNRQ